MSGYSDEVPRAMPGVVNVINSKTSFLCQSGGMVYTVDSKPTVARHASSTLVSGTEELSQP